MHLIQLATVYFLFVIYFASLDAKKAGIYYLPWKSQYKCQHSSWWTLICCPYHTGGTPVQFKHLWPLSNLRPTVQNVGICGANAHSCMKRFCSGQNIKILEEAYVNAYTFMRIFCTHKVTSISNVMCI